jgi:hypothetical protein
MPPRIATGDESLAIKLYYHVKFYQPKCWCVPIHDVTHPPSFSPDSAKQLRELQVRGKLEETMNSNPELFRWNLNKKKIPFYLIEAIVDFFSKNPTNK